VFVESEMGDDPFEVSDADTMLAYIHPMTAAQEPAAA